ncbi:MAG: pucR [Subtercola sp.]|nr:pucR [Subtercola sp.]
METIGHLVDLIGTMASLVHAPQGSEVTVGSCSIVDAQDVHQLATDIDRATDVVILLGADPRRIRQLVGRVAATGPSLIMVKADAGLPDQFTGIPVAVAVVHPEVGWGQLHGIVDRVIVDGRVREQAKRDGLSVVGSHTDLFGLANTLAAMMDGMVSIDDPQNRVMAFSPLDESADDLRRQCIMGRSAPPEHVELLRKQGVLSRLRQSTEAFVLPATETAKARLAVGMHDELTSEYLGAIWVQQGARPFRPRARRTLEAGGIMASRLIDRSRRIPSQESELLQQLLGLKQGINSSEQLVGALNLQAKRGWTVVGFSSASASASASASMAPGSGAEVLPPSFTATSLGSLSLQAVGLRPLARVAAGNDALYCVIPDAPPVDAVRRWAQTCVSMLSRHTATTVRAAIGPVAASSADLTESRAAVDDILLAVHRKASDQVVSYEQFETNLTLNRVLQALVNNDLLGPPRLAALRSLPHSDGDVLRATLLVYFETNADIRRGAEFLHVHPNTLRQRLRRIEDVTQLSLAKPEERLLLELEVRAGVAA